MTDDHPITPPPKLVQQWLGDYFGCPISGELSDLEKFLATQAAQWGSDQELEACCEWLETGPYGFSIEATAPSMTKRLRAARRLKPPSLKTLALAELDVLKGDANAHGLGFNATAIRKALEQLPE